MSRNEDCLFVELRYVQNLLQCLVESLRTTHIFLKFD